MDNLQKYESFKTGSFNFQNQCLYTTKVLQMYSNNTHPFETSFNSNRMIWYLILRPWLLSPEHNVSLFKSPRCLDKYCGNILLWEQVNDCMAKMQKSRLFSAQLSWPLGVLWIVLSIKKKRSQCILTSMKTALFWKC